MAPRELFDFNVLDGPLVDEADRFSKSIAQADRSLTRSPGDPGVMSVTKSLPDWGAPRGMSPLQLTSEADEFSLSIEELERSTRKKMSLADWLRQATGNRHASQVVADRYAPEGHGGGGGARLGEPDRAGQTIEEWGRSNRRAPLTQDLLPEASHAVVDRAAPQGENDLGRATPSEAEPSAAGLWTMKSSSFSEASRIISEWRMPPQDRGSVTTLYLYGLDGSGKVELPGPAPYADPHGDGLLSIEFADMWPEEYHRAAATTQTEADGRAPVLFNRQSFAWTKPKHRLLGAIQNLDGAIFTEAALTWNLVEAYARARETEHNLIVIPELSQCWLLADLAEIGLPDPPKVYSRKAKTSSRGFHIEITNYAALRKMYMLPEPPEEMQRQSTVAFVESVKKAADNESSDVFHSIQQARADFAMEGGPEGWMCPGSFDDGSDLTMGVTLSGLSIGHVSWKQRASST